MIRKDSPHTALPASIIMSFKALIIHPSIFSFSTFLSQTPSGEAGASVVVKSWPASRWWHMFKLSGVSPNSQSPSWSIHHSGSSQSYPLSRRNPRSRIASTIPRPLPLRYFTTPKSPPIWVFTPLRSSPSRKSLQTKLQQTNRSMISVDTYATPSSMFITCNAPISASNYGQQCSKKRVT